PVVGESPRGWLGGHRAGERLLALPHLVDAIDVEGPQLAKLVSGRLVGGSSELAGRHFLRDDEREILADRRKRDHVLVDDQVGNTVDESIDVELERTPIAR